MTKRQGAFDAGQRWSRPLIILTVALGLALLVLSWLMYDGLFATFLSSVLSGIGTTFLLFAALTYLGGRIVAEVTRSVSQLLLRRRPRWDIPEWFPASADRVAACSALRDIDSAPLLRLAHAFEYPRYQHLQSALTELERGADYDHRVMEQLRADLTSHVASFSGSTQTDIQVTALHETAAYLASDRPVQVRGDSVASSHVIGPDNPVYDVVIITGAAGRYVADRIISGLAIAGRNPAGSRVVMSGGGFGKFPGGEELTEADGMAEIAEAIADREHLRPTWQIVREDRSRTFRENVLLTLDMIQSSAYRTGRPQRVVYITAPYAARRLLWTAQELLHPYLADSQGAVPSSQSMSASVGITGSFRKCYASPVGFIAKGTCPRNRRSPVELNAGLLSTSS